MALDSSLTGLVTIEQAIIFILFVAENLNECDTLNYNTKQNKINNEVQDTSLRNVY